MNHEAWRKKHHIASTPMREQMYRVCTARVNRRKMPPNGPKRVKRIKRIWRVMQSRRHPNGARYADYHGAMLELSGTGDLR